MALGSEHLFTWSFSDQLSSNLPKFTTANLPVGAKDGALAWDTTTSGVKFSSGGVWSGIESSFALGASAGPSTLGLTLGGGTLSLDAADGTHPGAITSGTQTIGGSKTFSNGIVTNAIASLGGSVLGMFGAPTDGASAVGVSIGSNVTLANASAKLVQIKNNSTEKANFDLNGILNGPGVTASGAVTLPLIGTMADGASAVAVSTNSSVAYANATAKLLSVQNNAVEKFYVNKDGGIVGTAGLVALGSATAGIWGLF